MGMDIIIVTVRVYSSDARDRFVPYFFQFKSLKIFLSLFGGHLGIIFVPRHFFIAA